MHSWHP